MRVSVGEKAQVASNILLGQSPLPSPIAEAEEPDPWTDEDVIDIAETLCGEAGVVASKAHQAAVVWCILNRVDLGFGSIQQVIKSPGQFAGWSSKHPATDGLKELALDALKRWDCSLPDPYSSGNELTNR
jgi:hypothetical protein